MERMNVRSIMCDSKVGERGRGKISKRWMNGVEKCIGVCVEGCWVFRNGAI